MTATVANTAAVPDSTSGSTSSARPGSPAASPTARSNAPDPADLRLVIEEDQKAGCFVYKTVDWRTGEVVQQLPREEVVKLREALDYTAGAVISTRA